MTKKEKKFKDLAYKFFEDFMHGNLWGDDSESFFNLSLNHLRKSNSKNFSYFRELMELFDEMENDFLRSEIPWTLYDSYECKSLHIFVEEKIGIKVKLDKILEN